MRFWCLAYDSGFLTAKAKAEMNIVRFSSIATIDVKGKQGTVKYPKKTLDKKFNTINNIM